MALIDKLTAIAEAIRGKTGKTDALTLEQMAAEIAGISGGGSGGKGLAYDMGEFVLDADMTNFGEVHHNLGESPDFVLIWTDYFMDKGLSADNPNTEFSTSTNIGAVWLRGLTGLSQRLTSAATTENGLVVILTISANEYRVGLGVPTSVAYANFNATENVISTTHFSSNNWWRAGIPYRYFASKAWWEVAE